MTATEDQRQDARPTVGELLSEVSGDLTTLLRQEVELAKAEARQSATQAGRGVGMLTGAAIAADMALLFLSVAAWWWLGEAIGRGWSAVVVAVVWAVVALVLASRGRAAITSVGGMPRTADSVSKIPQAMTGNEETR